MTGRLVEIWRTPVAAAPMMRIRSGRLLAGTGLDGDRYALGGGTWARYPDLEKQVTLVDQDDVAAVAAQVGVDLSAGDTRRNLVTTGIELASLVGGWFAVGDALLFGMKRCPPCTHLERLTGARLVKAMATRGGINAAVFVGAEITEGALVQRVDDGEARRRGAPPEAERPLPRNV